MSSISVVIPCTRAIDVIHTIESVLAQRGTVDSELEVVVVGPDVDRVDAQGVVPVKTEAVHPPGRMRNIGAQRAQGELLFFIDDDCRAGPDWLRRNAELLDQDRAGAVTGRIIGASNAFFSRCTDYINYYVYQSPEPAMLDGALNTSTCAMRASLFRETGGFDEGLRAVEDIDMAMRLQRNGYSVVYDPGVVVYHHHDKDSFASFVRYSYRMGRNGGLEIERRYEEAIPHAPLVNRLGRMRLYWIFSIPFAGYATVSTFHFINRFHKRAWQLLPFMFLARCAYQFGVVSWLRMRKEA